MKNESETMQLFDVGRPGAVKVRHLGIESQIQIPFLDRLNGSRPRALSAEIVATMCGKYLRNYFLSKDVSYYRTDGSRSATPCMACGVTEPPPVRDISAELTPLDEEYQFSKY